MRVISIIFLTSVLLIALFFLLLRPKASDNILGKWEAVGAVSFKVRLLSPA